MPKKKSLAQANNASWQLEEEYAEDKSAIDEAQERLDNFFEILLRADLRTLERLQSKRNDENKLLDNV